MNPDNNRFSESYRRQASQPNWVQIDGERSKDEIAADVFTAVAARLGLAPGS